MPPQPAIGIGIIGLGFMGCAHVTAIRDAVAQGEHCELVAVCDRSADRRAGHFEGGKGNLAVADSGPLFDAARVPGYEQADDLLADKNVQLVVVCTHTETHVDLALKALAAGKHVLVEKPVSLSTSEVQHLEQASVSAWNKRGLRCMPGMCMRFWPAWDWLYEAIHSQRYGPLMSLSLQRLGTTPSWASAFYANPDRSGGAFGDLHIHDTDFICWALGRPSSVTTRGSIMHSTTLYGFDAAWPRHVVAESAWDLTPGAGFRMRYLAVFEHATAEFDIGRDPRLMLHHQGQSRPVDIAPGAGYLPELRHLLSAIRDPSLKLRATISDATLVSRVLDAERRSLEGGGSVTSLS